MAYSVSSVQHHNVLDGNTYLLDSNIWIEILTSRNKKNPRHQRYQKLFQEILKNNKASIVLPSLIVSEVLNRILREVSMKKFAKKNRDTITSDYFKNKFRQSDEYRIAYTLLCDDIKIHSSTVKLINDEFGTTIKYKHVLSNPPSGLDFNDFYYFTLAKKNDYIIVTDDKDFWVEDVKIITESPTLISRQKDEIGRMAREKMAKKD